MGAETRFRGVLDEVAVEPYAAVAARLDYGMVSRRLRGVLPSFGGFGFGEGARRVRLGVRYGDPLRRGRAFDLELAGERSSPDETAPPLRLALRGVLRL